MAGDYIMISKITWGSYSNKHQYTKGLALFQDISIGEYNLPPIYWIRVYESGRLYIWAPRYMVANPLAFTGVTDTPRTDMYYEHQYLAYDLAYEAAEDFILKEYKAHILNKAIALEQEALTLRKLLEGP